jgi:hypothetical protein
LDNSNQCVWTSVMTTILLRRKPSNASSLQIPQSLQVPPNLGFEPKQLRMFKLAIYIFIMKHFYKLWHCNKPIIYRKNPQNKMTYSYGFFNSSLRYTESSTDSRYSDLKCTKSDLSFSKPSSRRVHVLYTAVLQHKIRSETAHGRPTLVLFLTLDNCIRGETQLHCVAIIPKVSQWIPQRIRVTESQISWPACDLRFECVKY